MIRIIAMLGGGAVLAVLLMAAAILGGPVWGIVLVMFVLVGWAVVLVPLTQIDMMVMITATVIVVAVTALAKGGGSG